jgi:23S rRNA (cytidine1920-2'-O)/16S rRNA (cytidine1409-2'-O)-methyltransferase
MITLLRSRLDDLLIERGLAGTRPRAQALIAAGLVEVDGVRAASAALPVAAGSVVRLTDRRHPWDCTGRVCLDAGASTGGFTDVLLHRGALLVYAVDVGHGQIHPRLAAAPDVRVLDRTNVRTLAFLDGPAPSLVTLDLSFISLRSVLPNLARLAPGADVVALFKPQFEAARGVVARGGVVRDPAVTAAALADFTEWSRDVLGAVVVDQPVPAAVRGAKGNQEWLVHLRLPGAPA